MSLTLGGNLHSIQKKESTTQSWSLRMTQVSASLVWAISCAPSQDLNFTHCISACSDAESTVGPRLCALKREEGETYGFHLRVEKGRQGHIVRNVVSGGVGERCGLRDGDRLLEVNNCYVDDLPHPEVRAYSCATAIQGLDKKTKNTNARPGCFLFFRWPRKSSWVETSWVCWWWMEACMRRLCPEGKTREGWRVFAGARAVNHPDSATSPRILSLVWALTLPRWKVAASLAITGPTFQMREISQHCSTFVLCRRERSVFREPHQWRCGWEGRSPQRRSLGMDGRSSGVGSHACRTQPNGTARFPLLYFLLCFVSKTCQSRI